VQALAELLRTDGAEIPRARVSHFEDELGYIAENLIGRSPRYPRPSNQDANDAAAAQHYGIAERPSTRSREVICSQRGKVTNDALGYVTDSIN